MSARERMDRDPFGSLRSVQDKVAGMESALHTGMLETGATSANELVDITTEMLDELDRDRKHDRDIDAELIATLRVYRNAAFAFRKLAGASGTPDPAMGTVCTAMIEQGHHLLQAYIGQIPE